MTFYFFKQINLPKFQISDKAISFQVDMRVAIFSVKWMRPPFEARLPVAGNLTVPLFSRTRGRKPASVCAAKYDRMVQKGPSRAHSASSICSRAGQTDEVFTIQPHVFASCPMVPIQSAGRMALSAVRATGQRVPESKCNAGSSTDHRVTGPRPCNQRMFWQHRPQRSVTIR